jgi:hypothetical protein
MTDDDHREALAKLGRRRAEDFHWKRTAEKTLEIYRSVLTSKAESKGRELPAKRSDGGSSGSTASPRPSLAEER